MEVGNFFGALSFIFFIKFLGGCVMLLEVVGKEHFSGTSKKTGKDYDFTRLHCISGQPASGVDGQRVETVDCGRVLNLNDVVVGSRVEVYFNRRGYVDSIMVIDK